MNNPGKIDPMKPCILLVEDEADLRRSVELALKSEYRVCSCGSYADTLALLKKESFDAAVLDVMLGGPQSGLDILKTLHEKYPQLPAIMLTGMQDLDIARSALQLGACDYLNKPLDARLLLHTLQNALKQNQQEKRLAAFKSLLAEFETDLVADSPAMARVLSALSAAAESQVPVLLCGESGTGKEVLAKILYQLSRRSGPLVTLHCGAVPEALLEGILFGVERGAYTDAHDSRTGKLEQAHEGVLFLDEIGTMPLLLQSKLLRVLQDFKFEKVGGTKSIEVSVKVIAACNENLSKLIDEGKFRLDLYHRLAGLVIELPPLRDRGQDILTLARQQLQRCARKYNKPFIAFDPMAEKLLLNYPWPGNVRELMHTVEQSVLLNVGQTLSAGMLPKSVWTQDPKVLDKPSKVNLEDNFKIEGDTYKNNCDAFESFLIRRALKKTGGNQSRAAELMSISRTTLSSKISALGLNLETTL